MAKVTGLRNWRNGEIINARDYVYERNQVTDALNTNDDTLIDHETRITAIEDLDLDNRIDAVEADIDDLQAEEHLKLKYYGKATEAISKGDVVQFAGIQGDHYLIKKAIQNEVNSNAKLVMGIAYTDIANNAFGYVLDFGFLEGIDTKGFSAGSFIWFDSTGATPGAWTTTEPNGAIARILLAVIVRAETAGPANNGKLLVRVTVEPSIDEIQGITISDPQTGDILRYDGTKWINSNDLSNAEADILSLEGRMDTAESDIDDIENTLPIKADLIDGKIPQSQLPSYVDDVLEVYIRAGSTELSSDWLSLTNGGAALTPEAGKIYVIISAGDFEGTTHRWSGHFYSPVGDIALGETAATAFPGDRGLAVETQSNTLNTAVNIAGQVNTQIPYWNSTNSRFESDPQLTFNPALNRLVAYQALIQNNFYTETISTANGSPSANIALSSTGTIISRNINDTNAPLKVNKVQGTGNILQLQSAGANKLEVDVNGWLYQNGTRLFTQPTENTNTFFGSESGNGTLTTGVRNAGFGRSALTELTSGQSNTALGRNSLTRVTSGIGNVGVGTNAGSAITTTSNNTFVGTLAGEFGTQLATASNSTALGYQAYTDKSNQMVFGNASVTEFKFDRNASAVALLPQTQISGATFPVLQVERTTTGTNSFFGSTRIQATTSGDMVDGFGPSVNFSIKDNAATSEIGTIRFVRSGGDTSGRFIISTRNAGTDSEKMTILPNGNVGIGTASPVNALSVISPSNTDGIQIRRNSNTTDDYARLGFRINASDNNFNFAEIRGVLTNRINANDTDLIFLTFTGGGGSLTEKMRIRDDGKVGIGTSSPASQFSVSNGTVFNNVFTGGTEGYLGTSSNHRLFLITNFSIRQTITNDGLVGINETTPTAQLQVKSAATNRVPLIVDSLTGQTANLQEWQVNGTNVALVRNGAFRATLGIENLVSANRALVYLFDNGTIIQRNIADSNPALIVNQANASSTGDILKLRKAGTDVYAFTHDGTLKAPATFTIDPSAHGDATGKVIILGDLQVDGTTTTINSTTLEVDDKNIELSKGAANKAASDGAGISIDLGTDGAATLLYGSTADRFAINKGLNIFGVANFTGGYLIDSLYNLRINTQQNQPFTISHNSTERMRVTSTGNVGIGTTAPSKLLSLVTSSNDDGLQIRRNSANTNDYGVLGFRINTTESATNYAEIRGVRTNRVAGGDSDLRFATWSNGTISEKLIIRDDGNVGIGTTSPTHKLHLSTASGDTYIKLTSVGGDTFLGTLSNGSSVLLNDTNDKNVSFWTKVGGSLTEKVRLTATGLFGINETSPSAQLQVKSGATNRVPLIVDTLASHATLLQEWRVNGTANSRITSSGYFSGLGLLNFSDSNNGSIVMLNAGTTISRNIADSNSALIVNLANASSTGNIQVWQKAGVAKAYINASGVLFPEGGVSNFSTGSNAYITLPSTGTVISRNIADSNPALIVNLANASATGNIQVWQKAGSDKAWVDNNGNFVGNNTDIVVYETTDSVRTTSTYTTDLEITNLEANAYYEVEFVGSYYKTSTNSAGFRFGFTVSNTIGTPTIVGDFEVATNTTTGRLASNIYAIGTSIVTGSVLATIPETATTTRRHALFKGVLYTGTSLKTLRLQTAASTTLTNGQVGLKAGSFLKVRKVS
jgi:hypothetical protein